MDKQERYELLERLYTAVKRLRNTDILDDEFEERRIEVDDLLSLIGDL